VWVQVGLGEGLAPSSATNVMANIIPECVLISPLGTGNAGLCLFAVNVGHVPAFGATSKDQWGGERVGAVRVWAGV
jgi:hypothetical protein